MKINITKGLAEEWYKPELHNGDGAEFKLKPLDELTRRDVISYVNEFGRFTSKSYEIAFRNGVTDWKGVTDQDGKPLEFMRVYVLKLPNNIQDQIFLKLLEASGLGDEEQKNS